MAPMAALPDAAIHVAFDAPLSQEEWQGTTIWEPRNTYELWSILMVNTH